MIRLRPLSILGLALTLAASAGCSQEPPRATVKGNVTYKDKPLTGGTVVFLSEDGAKADRATITPEGAYTSTTVPIGTVRVGVEPVQKGAGSYMPKSAKFPKEVARPSSKSANGVYVDIPQQLRNPDSSGIMVTIEPGEKTWDIHLKDPK